MVMMQFMIDAACQPIVETIKNAALIAKPLVSRASDVGATVAAAELEKAASDKEKDLAESRC